MFLYPCSASSWLVYTVLYVSTVSLSLSISIILLSAPLVSMYISYYSFCIITLILFLYESNSIVSSNLYTLYHPYTLITMLLYSSLPMNSTPHCLVKYTKASSSGLSAWYYSLYTYTLWHIDNNSTALKLSLSFYNDSINSSSLNSTLSYN